MEAIEGTGGHGSPHPAQKRQVLQIANAIGGQAGHRSLYALCDDGTVWQLIHSELKKEQALVATEWFLVDTAPVETAAVFRK